MGAVAEEHGVEHGCVFGGEAECGWEMLAGGGGGEGLEAVGGPGLRGEDPAAKGGMRCSDDFYARGAGAGGGSDAFAEEVVGVGPGSGVAVDVWRAEAERDFDEVAAVEGELRAAEGEADASGGRLHDGDVGGDDLDGLEVDVD